MMPTSNQSANPAAGMTPPVAVVLMGTYPVFIEVPRTDPVAPPCHNRDDVR